MAITVRHLSKRYGTFQAVDDVSFDVPAGQLVALLGPSGSGKSTILRIIAGLETAETGTVELTGEDATAVPIQHRGVGFVFQHYALFRHMTVRENIAFGLKVRKLPKAEIRERVDELLDLVQLDGLRHALSLAALRRPAAAGGAGAGAGAAAQGPAAGRAVRCARRQGSRRAAHLAPPAARRGSCDQPVRDARPARGVRGRRPGGRAQPGPDRADGAAAGAVRAAGDAVRHRVLWARSTCCEARPPRAWPCLATASMCRPRSTATTCRFRFTFARMIWT